MLELKRNIWSLGPYIAITTNGYVTRYNQCVMGRGCALEAKERFPEIAHDIGFKITMGGNHVWFLGQYGKYSIFTFPVKPRNFMGPADIQLIERSAWELLQYVNESPDIKEIYIPRPGCGYGRLNWETTVKPVLKIWDDRFIVVYK